MLVTIKEAAAIIGISQRTLASNRYKLKGFPSPISVDGLALLYNKKEVEAYAERKKSKKEVKVSSKKLVYENMMALNKAFISGAFDPPYKQVEHTKRKANAAKANTPRLIITIIPDWMEDV